MTYCLPRVVRWAGRMVRGCYIFSQERRGGIISEPSGGSRNEKGQEVMSVGHVALYCCLQTPTIKPFPARRSGKNGALRSESKNLQRLEGSSSKKTLRHGDE